MSGLTLRARLTLTNLSVLVLAILALGGLLVVLNRQKIVSAIDGDLIRRGTEAAKQTTPGGRWGPGPRREDQPGENPGPPPNGPFGMGGPPPGFGDGKGRRPPPIDDPRANFGFALYVNSAGRVVRPRDFDEPYDLSAARSYSGRAPLWSVAVRDGQSVRVLTLRWRPEDGGEGVVQVARSLQEVEDSQQVLVSAFLVVLPLATLVAGLLNMWLTARALGPLTEITRTASSIGGGNDLRQRLPVRAKDEVGTLAATINEMMQRLELSFEERDLAYRKLELAFETQRQFTADASHELRTPLTRLKLATSSALSHESSPERMHAALATADTAADRMTRLVQELLLLSRMDAGQLKLDLKPVDLRLVAVEALDQLIDAQRIDVDLPEDEIVVRGEQSHLVRVILNLLENAIRHTPDDRAIRLQIRRVGPDAVLTVQDQGEGIAPEHLERVFDRFYQVDSSRSKGGSGLGLAICRSLVEAHGGSISLQSQVGNGTLALLKLPISAQSLSSRISHTALPN
ncbi:MAG: sensor histidine kinase [Fimbriimonas sp.]